MKKILALVLCLCMLTSLAMPVFAAEEAAEALLTVTELAPVAAVMEEEIPAVEETSDEEDAPAVEETSTVEETSDEEAPAEDGAEKDDPTIEEVQNSYIADSGYFAEEGSWSYYSYARRLVFRGYGKIPSYENAEDAPWAKYYDDVDSIEIEEYVSGIGDNAFAGFEASTLYLPSGLKAISASAFSGCTELENVYFDGSESELTALVGADYFGSSVTVHYSSTDDTTTGDDTTDDTTSDDTTTSGETGDLTWAYDETAKTLTVSGEGAIPDYERPDDAPWREYYDECGTIVIESGVTAIGTYAFADFIVSDLTIPGTVESIGQGAFLYCHELTEVNIPEGVKTLSRDAFGDCSGLTTVYLPSTLVDYGNSEFFAFVGCSAVTDVYYNGTESMFSMYMGKSYFPETTEIHYAGVSLPVSGRLTDTIDWELDEDYVLTLTGNGAIPDYGHSSETPWADYRGDITAIVIGEGITHAGDYAFDWCSNVTELTLPSTLISIGDHTFANGATGSTLVLPEGLKSIGDSAFQLNKLTDVTLPEGLQSIGASAFSGGELLETVFVPASVKTIGAAAFDGCEVLTAVYYDGTAEDWAAIDGATDNADLPLITSDQGGKLTDTIFWTFENGTLTITGEGAMPDYTTASEAPWAQHLEEITAVVIGSGVTAVGNYTFDGCESITELTLPESLESVGEAAFRGCGLSIVYVPGGVALADNAFDENPITTLSLGSGTEAIPQCFAWVTTLTHLELPPLFNVLDGDFIMQNEDLEIVVVGTEPYEGIEFVEWMDDDGYTYTNEDLLAYDVSGLTLYALYQYIWLDPGPFEDVAQDDWFYEYVKYCYQNGIMEGTSETTFEPDAGATRAEVVTVLYRMAGEPEVTGASSFGDVAAGQWYSDAVAWAAGEGIAKGYDDGNFWPHSLVTREEFLVFLNRFADSMGMNWNTWSDYYHLKNFADWQNISDWAEEAEVWSVVMGLQTGIEVGDETYLYPGDSILRSELATFLCRFMDSLYSILEVEMLQSCVGMGTDYVTQLFGNPVQKSVFVSSSSYEQYQIPDLQGCDGDGCSSALWYYDGFGFYIHKDADGTQVVSGWGYTE